MELKYNDITTEQWNIYNAVKRACEMEDLALVLEEDYCKSIETLTGEEVSMILNEYDDYVDYDSNWRENMKMAIKEKMQTEEIQ